MADGTEFTFTMDVYKPETIPMKRLAEYMQEVAKLLGSEHGVHFAELRGGSTVLAALADAVSEPKVTKRLFLVKNTGGPQDAQQAWRKIDDMLVEDNGIAAIAKEGSNVIEFPGRTRPKPEILDEVCQREFLDGELMQIGGTDDSVPVHLYNAEQKKTFKCNIPKAKARALAVHLFGPQIRVYGDAIWKRDASGNWVLKTMWIDDFAVLRQSAVAEEIRGLRLIPGNTWHEVADPLSELLDIRYGSEVAS